jgi:plastocyanin
VLLPYGLRNDDQESATTTSDGSAISRGVSVSSDTATDSGLSGKVTLSGQAPKNKVINMAADPVCSKLHSEPLTTEEVVVGPEGALANVIVYVSEGAGNRTVATPKEPEVIEQKGCRYQPRVVALQVGQKMRVVNSDATTHNIHPIPANNREWNESQAPGVPPIETSFGREEIAIPVKCNIHPWMKGYIAVLNHPYFAITSKDGGFVLKDLPPGNYMITAWHERLGTLNQKVVIVPKEMKKVEFTFKPQGVS